MKNTLKSNFEQLKQGELLELFEKVEDAYRKFAIDFYLIGARARDLWTSHLKGQKPRTTVDTDICIYIQSYAQFEKFVGCLIEAGFTPDLNLPYYGFENIPKEWIESLARRGKIENLAEKLK